MNECAFVTRCTSRNAWLRWRQGLCRCRSKPLKRRPNETNRFGPRARAACASYVNLSALRQHYRSHSENAAIMRPREQKNAREAKIEQCTKNRRKAREHIDMYEETNILRVYLRVVPCVSLRFFALPNFAQNLWTSQLAQSAVERIKES